MSRSHRFPAFAGVLSSSLLLLSGRVDAQCFDWVQRQTSFHPNDAQDSAMVFDSQRGQCMMVDRYGSGSATWLWGGNGWARCLVTTQSPPNALEPRTQYGHAMAHDSIRGVTVLFGGSSASTGQVFNETWEWDGTSWTRRNVPGPSARANHAMAFDEQRGVVVLFGGDTCDPGSPVTWEWDGSAWVQRITTTSPPRRSQHQMVYDSWRGVIVLFGGGLCTSSGNDTWEYDGSDWVQRQPPNSPSPRSRHGMAYDSRRRVTVLFGGNGNSGFLSDLWEWDGENWIERTPTVRPSSRYEHQMSYDAKRGKVVLFGGTSAAAPVLQDTWEYPATDELRIIQQPAGGNFCLGDDITLTVEALGSGPLAYQWRRNSFDCTGEGSQSPTLILNAADWTSEATFDVLVSDSCGTVVSVPASVSLCAGESGCPSPIDVNGDGTIDGADIQRFVEILLCDCG